MANAWIAVPRRLFMALGLMVACGASATAASGGDGPAAPDQPPAQIGWWDVQRRGANCGNVSVDAAYLAAAKDAGIGFLRLFSTTFPAAGRDFLIGNADEYTGLAAPDVARLKAVLDAAQAADIKILLTISSVPGARTRQQNDNKADLRLWRQPRYLEQVARFWADLAREFKGHPALVGYDILNEPHPERTSEGFDNEWTADFVGWYGGVKGSPADLNRFNRAVVAAVRSADAEIPIIVESGLWGSPSAFVYLEPVDDPGVLYSFHMYEPYRYTKKELNQGRFTYPGVIETHDGPGGTMEWNRERIAEYLGPVTRWAEAHGVPPMRILVGEFGVNRMSGGAGAYLTDVIGVCNERGWHWAFYAFREDSWPGMDYELGDRPLSEEHWKALERGDTPLAPRAANPIWDVLRGALAGPRETER